MRRMSWLVSLVALVGCGGGGGGGGGPIGFAVTSVSPTTLAPHDPVTVTLSRELDPTTVPGSVTVTISGQSSPVSATVSLVDSQTVQLTPTTPWPLDASLNAQVLTSLQSVTGLTLSQVDARSLATIASIRSLSETRIARTSAAAVTLEDGRVLLIGGKDPSVSSTDATLYDPSTDTFSATGSLSESRLSCAAFLLDDGRVAVLGGQTSGLTSNVVRTSVEVWSPSTGQWTTTITTLAPRSSLPVVTRIRSGGTTRYVVSGGYSTTLPGGTPQTAIEILNADVTAFTTSSETTTLGSDGVTLSSGHVVLAGQDGARTGDLEVLELDASLMDPVVSVTRLVSVLPMVGGSLPDFPTLAALSDDRVLCCYEGGFQVVTITFSGSTPQSASAVTGPSFGTGREREFALLSVLPTGEVFVGPGKSSAGNDGVGAADRYTPGAAGTGGTLTALGTVRPRRVHTLVALRDGRPAILGGREGGFSSPPVGTADVLELERVLRTQIDAATAAIALSVLPARDLLPASTTTLDVLFSGEVDASTVVNTSVSVTRNSAPLSVTVQRVDRRTLRITLPSSTLVAGDTVELTVGGGLRDAAGRALDLARGNPSRTWTVR